MSELEVLAGAVPSMTSGAEFDVVVYGATGFTGRYVAEYLAERAKSLAGLRWALAGRSRDRLELLRSQIGAECAGIVEADSSDPASLDRMVAGASVVVSAVGPYAVYGTPLVEACARSGTDYVDLCGEPNWMRRMIDALEPATRASGARILFSAGFDSVPSELGVHFVQRLAMQRFGAPAPRVRGRVTTFIGGPSGGSIVTGAHMAQAAAEDPLIAELLRDPFALTPGFHGPEQPSGREAGFDSALGPVRPFTLGPTDVMNVHRSNALRDHAYGTDFVYDEMLVGETPTTTSVSSGVAPQPGEGPGDDVIRQGCFEMLFIATSKDGAEVRATVAGTRDPGFGTSARIITETALLLAVDRALPPGIWTPGAAFGDRLIDSLTEHADMAFTVADGGTGAWPTAGR